MNLIIAWNELTNCQGHINYRNLFTRSSSMVYLHRIFFSVIRARCNPSQSSDKDEVKLVHVLLDKSSGQPYGGYCTCTVGYSQSCGHIGATLFCLSNYIASGVQAMPDQPACTDTLCQWVNPKGASVEPITMNAMKRRKCSTYHPAKKCRADFCIPGPSASSLNKQHIIELRARLLNATPQDSYLPATFALASLTAQLNNATNIVVGNNQLPAICPPLSQEIAYSFECTVTACPQPIAFLPHLLFDSTNSPGFIDEKTRFISSVTLSTSDIELIRSKTVRQSADLEWYRQRMGAVTASSFARILRFMQSSKAKPDSLLRTVQNYQVRGKTQVPSTRIKSLKWGHKFEHVARQAYEATMKQQHANVSVTQTGLCVSPCEPFLRASPDGIMSCSCHSESRLLEIKCPWSARYVDPVEAISSGLITYVKKTADQYELIPSVHGYYEQVQGTMAIAQLKCCDFVVWTPKGMLIISVPFNDTFWNNSMKPGLAAFFQHFVVPEILTERVWRGLPLLEPAAISVATDEGFGGISMEGEMLDIMHESEDSDVENELIDAVIAGLDAE